MTTCVLFVSMCMQNLGFVNCFKPALREEIPCERLSCVDMSTEGMHSSSLSETNVASSTTETAPQKDTTMSGGVGSTSEATATADSAGHQPTSNGRGTVSNSSTLVAEASDHSHSSTATTNVSSVETMTSGQHGAGSFTSSHTSSVEQSTNGKDGNIGSGANKMEAEADTEMKGSESAAPITVSTENSSTVSRSNSLTSSSQNESTVHRNSSTYAHSQPHSQPPTNLSANRRRNVPRAPDTGIKAIMEGNFIIDRTNKSVQFKGQWHLHGDPTTAEFQYESTVVENFPDSYVSQDVTAIVSLAGYFYFYSSAVPEKIQESDIKLKIGGKVPSDQPAEAKLGLTDSSSVVALSGTGKNRFGGFNLVGEYDTSTEKAVLLKRYEGTPTPSPSPQKSEKPKTPRTASNDTPLPRLTRGHRAKKPPAKFTSDDTDSPLFQLSPDMKDCYHILKEMMQRVEAQWFVRPVDDAEFPDYYQVITHPMDFQTIEGKLLNQQYRTVSDFRSDVQLVFTNCYKYNPPNSPAYEHAKQLERIFQDGLNRMYEEQREQEAKRRATEQPVRTTAPSKSSGGKAYSVDSSRPSSTKASSKTPTQQKFPNHRPPTMNDLNKKGGSTKRKRDDDSSVGSAKKKKSPSQSLQRSDSSNRKDNLSYTDLISMVHKLDEEVKALRERVDMLEGMVEPPAVHKEEHVMVGPGGAYDTDKPLDMSEKQQLSTDVGQLNEGQIQRLLEIVQEYYPMGSSENNEYEIDLNSVDTPGLRRLQQYVDSCLGRRRSPPKKKTPTSKGRPTKTGNRGGRGGKKTPTPKSERGGNAAYKPSSSSTPKPRPPNAAQRANPPVSESKPSYTNQAPVQPPAATKESTQSTEPATYGK